MSPKILEKPRTGRRERRAGTDSVRIATSCPPAARRPALLAALALLPPIAVATFVYASTAALPFTLGEEAALAEHHRLSFGAQAVASLLGSDVGRWRVFGATALGLLGLAVAVVAARHSRSRIATAVAGATAATHAAAVGAAIDVRGAFTLVMATAALGAVAAFGRRPGRKLAAVACIVVAALFLPAWFDLPGPAGVLRVALNRPPDAPLPALIAPALAVALIVLGIARCATGIQARVVACGAAIAFLAIGARTVAVDLAATTADRLETRRFLAQLDAIPPIAGENAGEAILDAPTSGRDSELVRARPARRLVTGLHGASALHGIRILHWAPPWKDGLLSAAACELQTVVEAGVDGGIELLAPAAGAVLPARTAEDEPEFRFSLPRTVNDLGALRMVLVSETGGRARTVVRRLEEATVRREWQRGAPVFVWRPGWRPMTQCERELRWEEGDVCPAGSSLWWTVAVDDAEGTRIAPFRRLSVQK